jgi:hypothetical protein
MFILKYVDFFGIDIKLSYKGNDSFKTVYGGLFSIITSLTLISIFIVLGIDIINVKNQMS